MKEVSCKVFGIYLRNLKRRKIPVQRLVEGTDLTVTHLQNASERVDWEQFRAVMANCSRIWCDEELISLGGEFFRDPRMAPISLIARVLFDARDFYAWTCKEREGAGNILFTCVRGAYYDKAPNKGELHLTMHDGYAPSREFFLVSLGSMRDGPRILSLRPANIEMVDQGASVIFRIDLPKGGGLLRPLRKALMAPFTSRAIARELSTANAALEQRYQQLELARQQVANQAAQLRIANEIMRLVHVDLDLDRTLSQVVDALVKVAKFAGARIQVEYTSSDTQLSRTCESMTADAIGEPIVSELEARGISLGKLALWTGVTDPSSAHDLLEHIIPSICMALDESIAFTIVNDYRRTLEQRVTDRTAELQTARDSLTQTVADLREAQSVRNKIFANINHEIRTPLSLIWLSAGELRTRCTTTDDRQLTSIANIESACMRLLNMVDSLLLLAAGQEGKLKVNPRDCDIAVETMRVVHTWQPLAKQNNVELSYSGPDRLAAYIDTAAIERILANLISNAIKYTPDNGSIEVSLGAVDESLTLDVRDTGIGIDDEFSTRIFGRFEQGRPAVRHGARSSGLGLSIVKELVEAHAGTVSVDSNPSGGTIFHMSLPVRATGLRIATTSSASLPNLSMDNLSASFGLSTISQGGSRIVAPTNEARATILVVEDDATLLTSIGELLLGAGYRVLLASEGFEALKLAAEYYPDMLLSDVGMPGMDGYELARRFRDLRQNRLPSVLFVTAYGTATDKLAGFQAGAVDYVVKPIEPRELLARVESQLKIRTLALRLSESEKLASLGTMSAGLAHEIRNPANGLLNALDPLVSFLPAEYTTPDTCGGQLISVIHDCARQIAQLSQQLLGFTREGTLTTRDEELLKLITHATTMVDAKTRGVEIRTRLGYAGTVRCAGPMLLQVVVNVLDNAICAAGGGGMVEIATRVHDDHRLIIDVSDSGPGVPHELRERIFEPFFTTKPPGAGTGLGLSTSRQIIDQHQGSLCVVEGTCGTFRIDIPLSGPKEVAVGVH